MGRSTDPSGVYGVVAITLSDTVDVPGGNVRGFTVGTAGDVGVIMADGSTAVLPSREVGVDYAYQVKRFLTTGTTATGIIGLR